MAPVENDPRFPEEIGPEELPPLEVPAGRLPPWPDDLLVGEKKELALAYLRGLGLPSRVASRHLTAWGAYTGTEITRRDRAVIRRDVSPTAKGE